MANLQIVIKALNQSAATLRKSKATSRALVMLAKTRRAVLKDLATASAQYLAKLR